MGHGSKSVRQRVPAKGAAGEGFFQSRGEGEVHIVRIDGGLADDALVDLELQLHAAPGEAPLRAEGEGQPPAEAPVPAGVGLPQRFYAGRVRRGQSA